jgi:hypothetical protein
LGATDLTDFQKKRLFNVGIDYNPVSTAMVKATYNKNIRFTRKSDILETRKSLHFEQSFVRTYGAETLKLHKVYQKCLERFEM